MNTYCKTFVFFTKVAFACVVVQRLFDAFFDVRRQFSPIYYPLLHWLANLFVYYPCGYLSIKMKESAFFQAWRIARPGKKQTMTLNFMDVLQGEMIFLLMCYAYSFLHLLDYGSPHSSSLLKNVAWFYLCIVSADVWFYALHWTLHRKQFYWIHKKHHEYVDVNGYVAEYKSLTESMIITTSDILPFILFGCDIHQFLAWIIVGVLYNVEGHSSMNLFFIPDDFHHKHHTHFNVNFGIAPYLDRLFGTDERRRKD